MGKLKLSRTLAILVALLLIGGCGQQPYIPRTRVPVTRSPTPRGVPPVILEIAEQITFAGEPFEPLVLDNCASDADTIVTALAWSVTGTAELVVTISERVATVVVPDPAWQGSEIVHFQACDPDGLCDSASAVFTVLAESQIDVTLVCNAGFVVSSRGKKVLIDALFDPVALGCPSAAATAAAMHRAEPPFDGADIVLITHSDPAHFDPRIVVSYMVRNPKAVLISSAAVFSLVQPRYPDVNEIRDRSCLIPALGGGSTSITAAGIQVQALTVPYGSIPNQGFLLDVGGFRVFHFGAADLDGSLLDVFRSNQLALKGIDIALVPHQFLSSEELLPVVSEGLQARAVVATHFGPGDGPARQRVRDLFPAAILLPEMGTYRLSYPFTATVEPAAPLAP